MTRQSAVAAFAAGRSVHERVSGARGRGSGACGSAGHFICVWRRGGGAIALLRWYAGGVGG
jgi:hypothetical protein